jgi:hypothetical protein
VREYTYNFEIKDLLTQFIAAFDDVIIKRYDKDKNPKELIEVRYVLAPKQRVMYDIVNKAQNLTLPVVAINVTGISRDQTRVFNKLDSTYSKIGRDLSNVLMPIPINIEISMSILARYMQDMDQIISNFVPYSNPYIILSWKEPTSIPSQVLEIRSEVLWNGSVSLTEPTDLAASDKFRIVGDTSFTIKGWLFRNKNELASQIYFIDANFMAISGSKIIIDDSTYSSFIDSLSTTTDTVSISATPSLTNAYYNYQGNLIPLHSNYTLNTAASSSNNFVLYGRSLSYTSAVALCGSTTFTNKLTTFNSKYTGSVTGSLLDSSQYSIVDNNIMTIDLSSLSGSGVFNIVINNIAGWTSTHTINNFTFTRP